MRGRKIAGLVAVVVALETVSAGAAQKIPLPTEADVIPIAPGEESILFGNKGIETLLPGPVDDRERVDVGVSPDGAPQTVRVRQRLVVHGLGDFRFKVSGPAQDVVALPSSDAEPGLRKGAALWQGFSDGKKVLSSEMTMFPDEEARRLPLRVSAPAAIDGQPIDAPASGRMSMTVTVADVSAGPVTTTSAIGDPKEIGSALDAVARELAARHRPEPGRAGVPNALVARGGVRTRVDSIGAPFAVRGTVTFETGSLSDVSASGAPDVHVSEGASPAVGFSGLVGGGKPDALQLMIRGDAAELGRPVLHVVARPAPPSASEARPPGGGSWTDRPPPGPDGARAMWDRLMRVSWQVAKLRMYDTYLGNPDPEGPGATVYRFALAPPQEASSAAGGRVTPEPPSPLLLVSALVALLGLAFDAVLLWSLS